MGDVAPSFLAPVVMNEFLIYLAALSAAYLLPGPDMALLLAMTASRGRAAGLGVACGLALSRSLHVLASGLGLATVLAAHPPLLTGLRWLGGAYLLWLAGQLLRPSVAVGQTIVSAPIFGRQAFRQGLLTNLLNPKAFLFCAFFLPQFVHPQAGNLAGQYAVLGVVLVAVGLFYDLLYVVLLDWLGRSQIFRPGGGRYWRIATTMLFTMLGLRVILA